jgi:hypothetical protein
MIDEKYPSFLFRPSACEQGELQEIPTSLNENSTQWSGKILFKRYQNLSLSIISLFAPVFFRFNSSLGLFFVFSGVLAIPVAVSDGYHMARNIWPFKINAFSFQTHFLNEYFSTFYRKISLVFWSKVLLQARGTENWCVTSNKDAG